MTGNRLHVTCDIWQMTGDTWHITQSVGWTFFQNFIFLALPVWDWECLEDIWTQGWVNEWMNELISHGGDCRTAPAKQGLLIIWNYGQV